MANKSKGFVVVAGKRPSGSQFWKVSGTLNRRQIRREFDDRLTAMAFAEQQNSELFGTRAPQAQLLTHLSPSQLRDAEAAFAQMTREFPDVALLDLVAYYRIVAKALPREDASKVASALDRLRTRFPNADLVLACDWFVSNYRPANHSVCLRVALEHYLADVNRRYKTKTLSKPQFDRIGWAMDALERHFGGEEIVSHLTTNRLQDYLKETTTGRDSDSFSNKTWNNRRGFLTTFFEFCRYEQWVEVNPASALRTYRKRDLPPACPVSLTTERAQKLMDHVETLKGGRLVPFFVLCLFAGIRPDYRYGEIVKIRPEHFDFEKAQLKLPATITKTRRARLVKLQPNVIEWLRAYPIERFPIDAPNLKKMYVKIRKGFALEYDVLRHTYCSMLVGKFRSVADASLQVGNSENVIWSNYLNLVQQKEAESFWSIRPKVFHSLGKEEISNLSNLPESCGVEIKDVPAESEVR